MDELEKRPESNGFNTTHWSIVLKAGQAGSKEQANALSQLCEDYWYPVYSFLRRKGNTSENAKDLTQSFFVHLIKRNSFASLDPQKGKFRSFLLSAVKNFSKDDVRKRTSIKRGGEACIVSMDAAEGESRFELEPKEPLTPEIHFHRNWVTVLLERVMKILAKEQQNAGKGRIFEMLKPHIGKSHKAPKYAVIADDLGMSEEAIKKAVQRLRQRYGFLLRSEIANTVSSADQVEEEINGLFEVWH